MIGALQRLASENTPLTSFAPDPSTVSCVPLARNYVDLTCAGDPSQKYL